MPAEDRDQRTADLIIVCALVLQCHHGGDEVPCEREGGLFDMLHAAPLGEIIVPVAQGCVMKVMNKSSQRQHAKASLA